VHLHAIAPQGNGQWKTGVHVEPAARPGDEDTAGRAQGGNNGGVANESASGAGDTTAAAVAFVTAP